jgi:hypothetical protein
MIYFFKLKRGFTPSVSSPIKRLVIGGNMSTLADAGEIIVGAVAYIGPDAPKAEFFRPEWQICNESALSGYRECLKKMINVNTRLETSQGNRA